MNRLILNTANNDLIVLLNIDDKVYTKIESGVKKHNEIILHLIDEVLKEHSITLNDIDEFGVVVGPGSFTGIRVGIATVKAFRDVFNKTAKGINNLLFLYELAKDSADFYAIEGSNNSYFVAEKIGNNLFINNRNLTQEELQKLAKDKPIACFCLTEQMKNSELNFVKTKIDGMALLTAYQNSVDTNLVPVYYQLSQAENDNINRAEIVIRQAKDSDVKQICLIENTNFEFGKTGDKPQTEKEITSIINNNMINIVAMINDELVGYLFGEKTDEINISRVAVKVEYQNHGIATKMIKYIESMAESENMNVSLEVSENNLRAYKLYTKLGYVLRRLRKDYYPDHSNCLEMVKNF